MTTATLECETGPNLFAVGLDTDLLDANHVDAFHELRSTLAGVLDVREAFTSLSGVFASIVPHDQADLALLTDDGTGLRPYASTREVGPLCADERLPIHDRWAALVVSHDGATHRGFQCSLQVPVLVDGKPIGLLVLLSKHRAAYSDRERALAERIADHIAITLSHQRLAEAARQAALERDRAVNLESFVELLRAISGVLDIRTVFPRISAIVNKVLPHDRMTMSFDNRRGEIIMQAASNTDFDHLDRIRLMDGQMHDPRHGFFIVDDLRAQSLPIAEPADLQDRMRAAGYRSFLIVNTTAGDRVMGLEFWAKRPNGFAAEDVPTARRIADHVALAIAHEELAETALRVAKVTAHAERPQIGVKSVFQQPHLNMGRVVGASSEWNDVLEKASKVASTETTVLLTGESGTGKEVVARFIQRTSARKDGPFVPLNCAALPEQLLESELFGYERGAFTGAQQSKPGHIERAAGGVLFLDEISEMSLSAQAKFLRVLQEREFQRLGSTRLQRANVRVIAATNRDLRQAIAAGTFRQDLYYRLQVFEIHLPPLRERRNDIPLLSEAFLQEIGESLGRPLIGLTKDAKAALLRHDWPGNARELRNVLERAAILCEGGPVAADHLALRTKPHVVAAKPTTDLNTVEREMIRHVMRATGGNKSRAAKRLGLSRTQLYLRLRKHSIENGVFTLDDEMDGRNA